MKLEILDELRNLPGIRQLNSQEMTDLAKDVKERGCTDPLVAWKRGDGDFVLIDGHHRKEICDEAGIKYNVAIKQFADIDAVKEWMYAHALSQQQGRKYTPQEMSLLRGELYNLRKSKQGAPVENQNASKNTGEKQSAQIGRGQKSDKTATEVAAEFGVSKNTIKRDGVRAEVANAVASDPEAAEAAKSLPQKDIEASKKAAASVPDEQKPEVLATELKSRATRHVPREVRENGCPELIGLVESGQVSREVAQRFVEQVPGNDRQREIVAKGADSIRSASRPKDKESKPVSDESPLVPPLKKRDLDEIAQRLQYTEDKVKAKLADYVLELIPKEPVNKKIAEAILRRLTHSPDSVKEVVVLGCLNDASDTILTKMKKWGRRVFGASEGVLLRPTLEEVMEFAVECKKEDPEKYGTAVKVAEDYFNDCESKGWQYGPNEKSMKPIKNWKSRFKQYIGWRKEEVEPEGRTVVVEHTPLEGEGILERKKRLAAEAKS